MSELSIKKDLLIRGSVINVSVTIETNIMRAVYFSSEELYTTPNYSKYLKLKGCMFGQKIERLRSVINEFHPDLKDEYDQMFDDLFEFKEFRNRMAHCGFYWGDSVNEFEAWDVVEDENGFQLYSPFSYTTSIVNNTIQKAISTIIPPLVSLIGVFESRLLKQNPELFYRLMRDITQPESK